MDEGSPELSFTAQDFARVRRALHERAGIALGDSKRTMVYNRLARRVRARGLTSFATYLDLVGADSAEACAFVNALTTNLTGFFREPHHFRRLAEHARAHNAPRLRIWCAASSTGEEPYSLAMTMIEAFGTDQPPVQLIASDIDTEVLRTAERGVYALERVAAVEPGRRARFFERGVGSVAGLARVRAEVRALVDFRHINLQGPAWPLPPALDVIMCRNVLIYFDAPAQRRVLGRFAGLLVEDGLLVTGHAENIFHSADRFAALGETMYRRRGEAAT